jgi:PIN domain nuclease of toxin-antitoxin system
MTGYLIDSHVLVWAVLQDTRLSRRARDVLGGSQPVYLSAATLWELSLKESRGKLFLPGLEDLLVTNQIMELPVRWREARVAASLPNHHADPFDRLIVAQAITEDLTLVTADAALSRYAVRMTY